MRIEEKHTPVYKNKPSSGESPISYFIVRYITDCVICLSFHTDPRVLDCGHILCKVCLDLTILHFGVCPICFNFIPRSYKMQWVFQEEVSVNTELSLALVRFVEGDNISNYSANPFSLFYYENGEKSEDTNSVFYQQSGGAPYYLNPTLIEKMKKSRKMPELIHGKVIRIRSKAVDRRFKALPHLPSGRRFFLVDMKI